MDTVTTILKYGLHKNCLLHLVDSLQNSSRLAPRSRRELRDDEVIVYEADLARGSKAYFSIQGNTVELSSGDTVQLNLQYASKLGLIDEEPLPLRRIKSTIARATSVHAEPVSVDDWEILEKNTGRVEAVLLDQVRVVWKGQILPVWIQPSICVFLKISEIEPAAQCVILETNTEVVVAPKVRSSAPPSYLKLPEEHSAGARQEQGQWHAHASKLSYQYQSMNSPSRNKAEQLTNSSEREDVDILEPRPSILSPSRSQRGIVKKNPASRPTNFAPRTTVGSQPFVQRQSSLMDSFNSFKKFIFPNLLMGEKKEVPDNLSDSDRGSLKDFSMKELPSRSGVLRVQPLNLSRKLEEYFRVNKAELNKQIKSKMFGFKGAAFLPTVKMSIEDRMRCNVPLEVFQPSTVYVDAEYIKSERLLHPYLPHLPNIFIARLQRLPSPQEKAAAAQISGQKVKSSNAGATVESSQPGTLENLDGVSKSEHSGTDSLTSISESCYVRVVTIDRKAGLTNSVWEKAAEQVLSHQPLLYGHVIIPDLLRRQLRLETTGSVWIQTGTIDLVIPRKIHIYPLSPIPKTVGNDIVIMAFTNYIKQCASEKHSLIVFQGIFLKFVIFPDLHAEVQLTFFGENDPGNVKAVTMLSEMNIDHIQIVVVQDLREDKLGVVKAMLPYCQTTDFDPVPFQEKLKQLGGVDSLVQQALLYLHASLASRPLARQSFEVRGGLSHGIILITGPKGSGKSSLVKGLCRKMTQLPVLAHVTGIDCKILRGKTVSNIKSILEMAFDEAAWREPAVIVLENLDVIVPAASGPETEMSPESLYSAKNAQVLEGLIRYEIENNSRVAVIATSISLSSINPCLTSSRGLHCIQQTLNIGSPDKDAREKILLSILQRHNSISLETAKTLDLTSIAVKTEGYVARDLELLVNRTLHAKVSTVREASSKFTLTLEDFEETLCTFKPVSVRNVPLHKAGDIGWLDVGGLESVKKVLVETLRWPTKYPQLFSSCPLRLRSGIMLYGAPGTGKTLLAGVVAKECGLNFISVKGPELLNKYIGASEQAIRDLFTKAQSAKPCVLFFDEFDSIAPKRGHDSTGVTDRVVNQLLTQLDGVEGLQGVYVLAATSRPDLIDPALLRPGRLDICLNCSMPDENERNAILVALTSKMSLAADVDLKEVAAACEYFTGADLKALLYNAQLKVIHEQTDDDRSLNKDVVYLKGDSSQSGTIKRKASVIMDAGMFSVNLAKSCSGSSLSENSPQLKDLQSPRQTSRSSEQSPKETSNSISKRAPRSHHEGDIPFEDEVDFAHTNGSGDWKDDFRSNQFKYPDRADSGSGDEVFVDISATDGQKCSKEITDEVNGFPLSTSASDSRSSVTSVIMLDAVPGDLQEDHDIQNSQANNSVVEGANGKELHSWNDVEHYPSKAEETNMAVDGTELGLTSTKSGELSEDCDIHNTQINNSALKGTSDEVLSDIDDVLHNPSTAEGTKMAVDGTEIGLTSAKVASTSAEEMFAVMSSFSPHQDDVDAAKAALSDAINSQQYQKSAKSNNPKRRRGFERASAVGNPSNLSIKTGLKQEDEVRSPSLDRPITVYTSLESGVAKLSEEDLARYLAMMKEIQYRGEVQFQPANTKRRTSLQVGSKMPILMEVCQRHLLEAVKSMRPSVSASERERYIQIYDKFVSSRKVEFDKHPETTIGQRATLA